MKKVLILLILVAFSFYVYHLYTSSYESNYEINNYKIYESYKNNKYYLEFSDKNIFPYELYVNKKVKSHIVQDIDEISINDGICVRPIISNVKTYPICYLHNQLVSYDLVNDNNLTKYLKDKSLKTDILVENSDFKIYDTLDSNTFVAVYNYYGYNILQKKSQKDIKLFENDHYDNSLAFSLNNYIVTPDYDEGYEYNTFYIINIINNEYKEIKTPKVISNNFYYCGTLKNNIYFFDIKYENLYKIDLNNYTILQVGSKDSGYIKVKNDKEVEATQYEYKNRIEYFNISNYENNYKLIDNEYYKEFNDNTQLKLKVLNGNFEILRTNKDYIFYINNDDLYYYSYLTGSTPILTYKEVMFNKNLLFVYNK